ncbi:hypothetical protein JCM19235_1289 [Vibrio maritimus]|uniref:Uncharacterized protein n=1 Tax=Vibrio maritimus TaxID=990268 RepID=A0A090S895_9VIBR|nr:hypothetical protein JCM19235_1289 [Vibrio maritimus]
MSTAESGALFSANYHGLPWKVSVSSGVISDAVLKVRE